MAKTQHGKYNHHTGYTINPIFFLPDLYFLSVIFGASKNIYKNFFNSKERSDEHIFNVFKDIEYSEVQKRIISIATICRNELENNGSKGFNLEENNLGTLWVGKKKTTLDLLNTCHKIIHARNIEFDASSQNKWLGYLRPKVYLCGMKDNKEWKATINIYKFINSCFQLL